MGVRQGPVWYVERFYPSYCTDSGNVEQEAHYIAEWMAKAFDKTDCYAFVLTGVKVGAPESNDMFQLPAANYIF
jgi:hypothetical protein